MGNTPLTEEVKAAVQRLLHLLERSDRFEAELRRKIANYPEEVVDAAVGHLRAYIDDRRPLQAYLRAHEGRAAKGREMMRSELLARGAPSELIEDALEELPQEEERAATLLQAERKNRNQAQAGRFLASRGFDEDAIVSALERQYGDGYTW